MFLVIFYTNLHGYRAGAAAKLVSCIEISCESRGKLVQCSLFEQTIGYYRTQIDL